MTRNVATKPFIPRDRPKSWVVLVAAGLIDLLIVAPLMFLCDELDAELAHSIASTLFVAVWAVGFFSGVFFLVRLWGGRYKRVAPSDWRNQVW